MRRNKIIENIPQYNSIKRKSIMNRLTTSEVYIHDVTNKGLPFFTDEQLTEIEKKYSMGMTMKNLIDEIHKKGWQIKESTIRSYIQKKLIPGAIRGEKTDKGMISVYPKDTIRHLNFVRYLLFSDSIAGFTLELIPEAFLENSDLEILERALANKSYENLEDIQGSVSMTWGTLSCAEDVIKEEFGQDTEKYHSYLDLIKELHDINQLLEEKYKAFCNLLATTKSKDKDQISDFLERMLNHKLRNKS